MIEDFVAQQLEEKTFEDLLEGFDLTPQELFVLAYDNGLIDEELLQRQSECI